MNEETLRKMDDFHRMLKFREDMNRIPGMILWFKCPDCKVKIKTVYCENCGEEIEIQKISLFMDKELPITQDYYGSRRFYSDEYENIRYGTHLFKAFSNPGLKDLCELILK